MIVAAVLVPVHFLHQRFRIPVDMNNLSRPGVSKLFLKGPERIGLGGPMHLLNSAIVVKKQPHTICKQVSVAVVQ